MGSKKRNNQQHKCKLFPHEIEEIVSLQEAKQLAGWSITAFDLPNTWNKTKGEGVKIAVLDSGCNLNHSDLNENLLPGINFVNPGEPPEDKNSHGTHISGIICAENNDIGMVGVAPNAKVMPVKVLNDKGLGNLETVAKGVKWAADNGADIMCMSLGSPRPLQQIRKAIQYAAGKGIPIFVAAGNVGLTKDVFYPSAYPETIAVGSIDENFNRSSFSNTGKNLDFLAPGGKIFSTIPDNWYGVMSGTSMSAPWAAGVAALLLSYVRNHNTKIKLKTVNDYRNALKEQTISLSDPKYASIFFEGLGIIDPRKFDAFVKKYEI